MKDKIKNSVILAYIIFIFSGVSAFADVKSDQRSCKGTITLKSDTARSIDLVFIVTDIHDEANNIYLRLVSTSHSGEDYDGLVKPVKPNMLFSNELLLTSRSNPIYLPLFNGYFRESWGLGASLTLYGTLRVDGDLHDIAGAVLLCHQLI